MNLTLQIQSFLALLMMIVGCANEPTKNSQTNQKSSAPMNTPTGGNTATFQPVGTNSANTNAANAPNAVVNPASQVGGCTISVEYKDLTGFSVPIGSTAMWTKEKCAKECDTTILIANTQTAAGCSYSCKWNSADIVQRFYSDTQCKSATADPF